MLDKLLKLNIRLSISYITTAICTYYIGFGIAKLITEDVFKLIFIVGTFIISFVLSFWIIRRILPIKKKLLVRNKFVAGLCVAFLCLCLIIEAGHLFIWFVYKDVIPLQVSDPYELHKIATTENIKFYGNGTILDSDDLYKFKAEPEALEKIAKKLNFVEVDRQSFEGEVLDFWNPPPYWWNPKLHKNIKWYKFINISQSSHRGGMLYDLDSKTAYMEMWDS